MKFTKKTRLLLAFVLSVTVASSSFVGIPVKADVNVKTNAQSQTYRETSLKYVQGTLQNTKYGKVQGYQENEGKTLSWKGVPYAKSPVGELRWKSPVDPEVQPPAGPVELLGRSSWSRPP